jgi:predicted acylesterase/phospholipase RssA
MTENIFKGVLNEIVEPPYITDLVLAGGAYYALAELGVIKEYIAQHVSPHFIPEKLKNIYGTSVGSIMGVMFSLNIPIDDIIEYIINRPWKDLFEFQPHKLFSISTMQSIYSINDIITELLKPFFESLDLDIETMTLKELFLYSRKTLYIYTATLSTFELVEVSYKSHPDLLVKEALKMSCAIPFVFEPIKHNGTYYMDGGTCLNYPLYPCLKRANIRTHILGIKISYFMTTDKSELVINNMFDTASIFLSGILNKTFTTFDKEYAYDHMLSKVSINEFIINTKDTSHIEYIGKLIYSVDERRDFIEYGKSHVTEMISRTPRENHMLREHHISPSSHPEE